MTEIDEERFSRQTALFGVEGQKKIQQSRVALVGLGGLGSHLAQQLTFLGVRNFALIDHDITTSSSRNRVIGARTADVSQQTPKVEVARRLIIEIDPEADVATHAVRLADAHAAFLGCTVVFGAVDNDLVRLELTEVAAHNRLPYFDLASDTGADDDGLPTYGGRIVFADGSRCLHCLGLLDPEDMRRAGLPENARQAHDEIYGIEKTGLGDTGPAVVSVNGVVASLAVSEFMVWTTGVRELEPQLIYYGERRMIRRSTDDGGPNCPYCRLWHSEAASSF